MKGIFSYLLKPSTNDPEAVKQAYYDSLKSTHVMMLISFVMSAIFLVMSYVNPVFFGTEPTYHRLIYLILFLIVMLWFAVARYAVVDYNIRYKSFYFIPMKDSENNEETMDFGIEMQGNNSSSYIKLN